MTIDLTDRRDKMPIDRRRPTKFQGFFICAVFALLILLVVFITQTSHLLSISRTLAHIDSISGKAQRLVKAEIVAEPNDMLVAELDDLIKKLNTEATSEIFVVDMQRYKKLLLKLDEDWGDLKKEIERTRENGWSSTRILFVSERFFFHARELQGRTSDYFENQFQQLELLKYCLIASMLLVTLLLLKQIGLYIKRLQRNRKLSEIMYFDAITGIYNKSKCEEFFNASETFTKDSKAVSVYFEIDDIKNMTSSHAEDLILQFSTSLKEVVEVFTLEPFFGRYDDDFVVHFNDITKNELLEFLKSLDESLQKFNEKNTSLSLNYATGYAFSQDYGKITKKELLVYAAKAMYENKLLMKKEEFINIKKANTDS